MSSTKTKPSSPEFLTDLLRRKDVLKIIVLALSETITGYTKLPVTPKSPFLKESGKRAEIGVAGIIRFEGPDFSVEILMGLSKSLFLNLYENMFQSEAEEISEENQDLAAEILNIAFGIMDPKFKKNSGSTCALPFRKFTPAQNLKRL